jgi:hypothetical protein
MKSKPVSNRIRIRAPRGANEADLLAEKVRDNAARILSHPASNLVRYGDLVTIIADDKGRMKVGKVLERPYPLKVTIKFHSPDDEKAIVSTVKSKQRKWPVETTVEATDSRPGFLSICYPADAEVNSLLGLVRENYPKARFSVVPLTFDESEE